jgi:hypothetical protein
MQNLYILKQRVSKKKSYGLLNAEKELGFYRPETYGMIQHSGNFSTDP